MQEFTLAHQEAIKYTKTNFIIIVLKEHLEMTGLRKNLRRFLTTHNYIDATRKLEQVPERLRYFSSQEYAMQFGTFIHCC